MKLRRKIGSSFPAGGAALVSLVMLSPSVSRAQEAPAAAPAPACSGVMCLFSGHLGQAPAAPAPQPAPQTAETAPVDETTPVKAKPKPVKPVVKIAAAGPEVARLKSLAASLPREKVAVVQADGAGADFTVTAALDAPAGTEKARLFTEKMHIVAGGAVTSLADLKDKIVSFGPDKGASQAAARKAFAALGITVKETPLDFDNALDGVSTGDIAAVVILAPEPFTRLASVPGVHLVGWPDGVPVPTGAVATAIDGAAYPGLVKVGDSIPAMGVDAVLSLNAASAHKAAAKTFLVDLSQHADTLSRRGFDLIKADIESRSSRRVASAERR